MDNKMAAGLNLCMVLDWVPERIACLIRVFIAMLFPKFKGDTDSYFHEENLLCSTLDLFLTGTETTATAIRWALLYMATYPHIQGGATDGSFV